MRKFLHILIFTLIFAAFLCISVSAATWTDSDGRTWSFDANDTAGTATITGANLKSGESRTSELNIPAKVYVGEKEYTVTKIAAKAFKCGSDFKPGDTYLAKKYFGHVTLPDTLIEIGESAFEYSAIYGEIIIPESVTTIGNYAFRGCVGLDTVVFPTAMTTVPTGCFYDCKALVDFSTKGTITTYSDYAFYNCQSLLYIDISPETTSIGRSAFQACYCISGDLDLTKLTKLGDNAFSSCTFISSVTLGACSFNTNAFSSCSNLKSFNISEESEKYCSVDGVLFSKDMTILYRFPLGKLVSSYVIPDSVVTVEDSAFYGATTLTSIKIGSGVKTIKSNAFRETSVQTMYFPKNVTSVGSNVLYKCDSLVWVVFDSGVTSFRNDFVSGSSLRYIFTTHGAGSSLTNSGGFPGGEKFTYYIEGRDCVSYYGSHFYGYLDTAATCDEDGTNVCCFCKQEDTAPALGHIGQILRVSELSCTTNESITVDCINCNLEQEIISIPAKNHTLTEVKTGQSDKYNFAYRKCTDCGEVILESFSTSAYTSGDINDDGVIDSKDSLLLGKIISGSASTANKFACDINGDATVDAIDLLLLKQYIAQLGETISKNENTCKNHIHVKTVTVSYEDCTYGGLYVSFCADCGAVIDETTADIRGHFFVESVISQSTCSTAGKVSRVCSVCQLTEEVETEKLEHTHSWWMLSDDELDYEYSYCKVCNTLEHREVNRAVLQEIVATIPENYTQYCTAESAALLKPIVDNAKKALTQEQVNAIVEEIRRVLPTIQYKVNNIPAIYLESADKLSKTEYSPANIIVAYTDENGKIQTLTDAEGEMRIRGNYTSSFNPKLPFNIKFSRKVDLLGMGEGKKYHLLANAYDATTIRNALAFEFAADLGLQYNCKYRFVELYHNGVYKGCYTLTTPIDIGEGRVDIDEEKDIIIHLSQSNGYEDSAFPSPIFELSYLRLEEPSEYSPYTRSQMMRIMYQLDFAILSGDTDEMAKYMDVDSMVRYFVFHEYVKDTDVVWDSTRFYIEDGKLHGGPVWDLDISQGNIPMGGGTLWSNNYEWLDLNNDNIIEYNYKGSGVENADIKALSEKGLYEYRSALGTWASIYWAKDYMSRDNKSTAYSIRWWFYYLAEYSDEFMVKVAEYIRDNQEMITSYFSDSVDPITEKPVRCVIDELAMGEAGEAILRNFIDASSQPIYKSSTFSDAVNYLRTWWEIRNDWVYKYYTETYLDVEAPQQ